MQERLEGREPEDNRQPEEGQHVLGDATNGGNNNTTTNAGNNLDSGGYAAAQPPPVPLAGPSTAVDTVTVALASIQMAMPNPGQQPQQDLTPEDIQQPRNQIQEDIQRARQDAQRAIRAIHEAQRATHIAQQAIIRLRTAHEASQLHSEDIQQADQDLQRETQRAAQYFAGNLVSPPQHILAIPPPPPQQQPPLAPAPSPPIPPPSERAVRVRFHPADDLDYGANNSYFFPENDDELDQLRTLPLLLRVKVCVVLEFTQFQHLKPKNPDALHDRPQGGLQSRRKLLSKTIPSIKSRSVHAPLRM